MSDSGTNYTIIIVVVIVVVVRSFRLSTAARSTPATFYSIQPTNKTRFKVAELLEITWSSVTETLLKKPCNKKMVLYHLPYIGIKTKPFSTVQSFVSLILKPMLSRIIITIKSLKVAPSTPLRLLFEMLLLYAAQLMRVDLSSCI